MSTSAQAAARHEVGRLEHDRVAVGERRRDLPGRDGDREVPRRDHADDADRLAGDLDVDARAHGGELLAGEAQRLAGEEGEDLAGAGRLADALGQRLALLARQQAAEFLLAGEDLVGGLLQDRRSAPAASSATRPGRPPWRRRWPPRPARAEARAYRRPRPWCWTG